MREIWKKLDGLGKWSARLIAALALSALTAYMFIPDKSANANTMHLELAAAAPGTKSTVLTLSNEPTTSWQKWFVGTPQSPNEQVVSEYTLKGDSVFFKTSQSGPWKARLMDAKVNSKNIVEQRIFLFGTDNYGRDYLSRLVLGARVSLSVGLIAVFISLLIGIAPGSLQHCWLCAHFVDCQAREMFLFESLNP